MNSENDTACSVVSVPPVVEVVKFGRIIAIVVSGMMTAR